MNNSKHLNIPQVGTTPMATTEPNIQDVGLFNTLQVLPPLIPYQINGPKLLPRREHPGFISLQDYYVIRTLLPENQFSFNFSDDGQILIITSNLLHQTTPNLEHPVEPSKFLPLKPSEAKGSSIFERIFLSGLEKIREDLTKNEVSSHEPCEEKYEDKEEMMEDVEKEEEMMETENQSEETHQIKSDLPVKKNRLLKKADQKSKNLTQPRIDVYPSIRKQVVTQKNRPELKVKPTEEKKSLSETKFPGKIIKKKS